MGLRLVAATGPCDDPVRSKRLTRSQRRSVREARQPLKTNAVTEEALADFVEERRATGAGLPELARWDPYGRPEHYRPEDLDQVVSELAEALARPELVPRHRDALREALALARRCQAERLYLHVVPD